MPRKATQTAALENEISSITESFFRPLKRGSLLKKSGVYKEKGVSAFDIFRKLFEPGLHHKKMESVPKFDNGEKTGKGGNILHPPSS